MRLELYSDILFIYSIDLFILFATLTQRKYQASCFILLLPAQ